ncbi:hypothetical protein CYY_006764 [Polysphondylium violaceum]|uniref:Sugar transporter SWEET1 n=1 Tax=Polysphondylium violaceum TaxID=133409 RepID=A0A8J4V2U5_9MYCE|nr:hypothetical protein CYY_006764 [Polysphondylium violaceum]
MTSAQVFSVILSVLGNILSTLLSLSSIKQFILIDKTRNVGNFNIYPIIMLCANSLAWVCYGMSMLRATVIPVNAFGLLITLYYFIVYYGAVPDYHKRRMLALIFFGLMSTTIVFIILVMLMVKDRDVQGPILGYTCNVILFGFYFAPIISLYGVIKSKDTSSINFPLAIVQLFASIVWVAFGYLVGDAFIWVPNSVGAFLAAVQLVIFIYINKFYKSYKSSPSSISEGTVAFINETSPPVSEEDINLDYKYKHVEEDEDTPI